MGEHVTETAGETETHHERRSRRLWTVAILVFVAVSGLGMQMRGALIPELGLQFGVSESFLGFVAPAGTFGYTITILIVGAIAGRINTKQYFLLGLAILTVGVLGMGLAPGFFAYLSLLLIRGLGTGVVRALDRPILSHLYPESRGRMFNIYDLSWAIGSAAGPIVMSAAIAVKGWQLVYHGQTLILGGWELLQQGQTLLTGGWRLAYYGVAIVFVGIILFVWWLPSPGDSDEKPLDVSAVGSLLRTPEIAATILALMFHTGLEGAMFIWLPTFGIYAGNLPQAQANLLLSAYTFAYIPGRLFYTFTSEKFGYGRLVIVIEILIIPVFLWTFFVATGLLVFVGVIALGLLISGVFPTIMAFGTDAAPEYSAPINALGTGMASITISLIPLGMGVITDMYGIRMAMWLPLVFTAAVAPIIFGAMRIRATSSAM